MKRAALLASALFVVACPEKQLPPTGQIVLYVTTDAILPPPPGASGPPGMFDRLSIEIFPPDASAPCVGCAREVAADAQMVDEGRASMGYVPHPGASGSRARVRLFRTGGATVVGPRVESTLEAVVDLPVVGEDGVVEITVDFPTDTLAHPQGTLDAPIAPIAGRPTPGRVGTWQADRRRPCAGARDGEVCVPGGAFWLGEPAVALVAEDQRHGLERLVAVSPFVMDATEATVKQLRDASVADSDGPVRHSTDAFCTYTDAPAGDEDLPVTCLPREHAIAFCATKKMRLPTEAEWEYVATALGRYDKFPWGADLPRCGDASFGHAQPPTNNPPIPPTESACAPPIGAQPVGSAVRDRVVIDGATIFDLAGNVSEWLADTYQDEWESCFAAPILLDPLCKTPSVNGVRRALRGPNFLLGIESIDVKIRIAFPDDPDGNSHGSGVRCVRASD